MQASLGNLQPYQNLFWGAGKFCGQLLGGAGFCSGYGASKAVVRVSSSSWESWFGRVGFRNLKHDQILSFQFG